MAISDDGKRGQIGPSLRGLIYQYERSGQWVTSAWPKKRGKAASPKQKLAQQAFKDVMLAMKMTAAPIQSFHRAAATGTPMLPRDTLMAALYGNGPPIHFYSGKVIKPMANRILSSTVLDALGIDPGGILYRGDDLWEFVPPGLDGQVLSFSEAEKRPVWLTPGGGGEGKRFIYCPATREGSSLYNVTGNVYCLAEEVSLVSMSWVLEAGPGGNQRVGVATMGADRKIDAIVYPQRVVAHSSGAYERLHHKFDAPITIPAFKHFYVWTQYADDYPAVATGLRFASAPAFTVPMMWEVRHYRGQHNNVTVGLDIGWGSDQRLAIDLEFA